MSDNILAKIVNMVVWLHTPSRVKRMSVFTYIGELQSMAHSIGLTMTRSDLQKALMITIKN